tara:strand:+ start:4317 stop:6701 length:2385 start_codon:yes stop_codon:yes gene_type:complete
VKNIFFLKKIIISTVIYFFLFSSILIGENLSTVPIFLKDDIFSDKAYCENNSQMAGYSEFIPVKSISIEFFKNRKWISNLLDTIVSSKQINYSSLIDKKFKKKFTSNLTVEFQNGIICDFTARIRIHGDLDDHIMFEHNSVTSSMDVVLQDGSINSIVGFKLFLPSTRENDNEIFATTLFSNLGFLSPKTFYVPVKINGSDKKFIFQEKIQKEMLESNQLRESAIFEGDERWSFLGWDSFERLDPHPSLMELIRMSNAKWSTKSSSHQNISIEGMKIINQIYLRHVNSQIISRNLDIVDFEYNLVPNFHNNIREMHEAFETLQFALSAEHGLSSDESRYYYDAFYKDFIPIYYDGEVRILNSPETPITVISQNSKKGILLSLKIIDEINHKKFHKDLVSNGVNLSIDQVNALIMKIRDRILSLNNKSTINILDYDPSVNKKLFYENFKSNIKIVFDNNKIISQSISKESKIRRLDLLVCNHDLTDCTNTSFDKNQVRQLLAQEYVDENDNNYIYIGISLNDYKNGFNKNNIKNDFCLNELCKWKSVNFDNSTIIRVNQDITYSINDKSKIIEIHQLSHKGKVVFYSGRISDWTINFKGFQSFNRIENFKLDSNGLTGCITFVDINIENVLINTKFAPCEDSINFIRANGKNISININESKSDALDADFSTLEFNTIDIIKSDNDCLDFSGGKYKIELVRLNFCGDKAISVGESSVVELKDGVIKNSKVGIATKDSSSIFINKLDIENVDLCLAAYRKKQEFIGALIDINHYRCNNYIDNSYISIDSKLRVKNEL